MVHAVEQMWRSRMQQPTNYAMSLQTDSTFGELAFYSAWVHTGAKRTHAHINAQWLIEHEIRLAETGDSALKWQNKHWTGEMR